MSKKYYNEASIASLSNRKAKIAPSLIPRACEEEAVEDDEEIDFDSFSSSPPPSIKGYSAEESLSSGSVAPPPMAPSTSTSLRDVERARSRPRLSMLVRPLYGMGAISRTRGGGRGSSSRTRGGGRGSSSCSRGGRGAFSRSRGGRGSSSHLAPQPRGDGSFQAVLGGYSTSEVDALEGKGNSQGCEFDLGKDGAFSDFSVVVLCLYSAVSSAWGGNVGAALGKKGFRVTLYQGLSDIDKYVKDLHSEEFDVAWLIEGNSRMSDAQQERLVGALRAFSDQGRGVFLWADNAPYFSDVNPSLHALTGARLVGNTPGGRVMGYGEGDKPGEFDQNHILFAGINYLFEGITICYPQPMGKLVPVATSSNGKPCIACSESDGDHGRILCDTGFTKLYCNWTSAGQARYVVNACVWLVDVERRFEASSEE